MWTLSRRTFALSLVSTLLGCGAVVRPPEDGGAPPDAPVPTDPGCLAPDGQLIPVGREALVGCRTCACLAPGRLSCGEDMCDDGDGGVPEPVCIAPDRMAVPSGSRWRSPDGCTVCECAAPPGGSTPQFNCVSSGDCPSPPDAVCRAPDGTAVPQGGRWRSSDGCTVCECGRDGGLRCASSPGCEPSPEPPPPPPPPSCAVIPSSPTVVTPMVSRGAAPIAAGGAIQPGFYNLSSLTLYGSGGDFPPARVRWSLEVVHRGGANMGEMRFAVDADAQPTVRAEMAYTTSATRVQLLPTCGPVDRAMGAFSSAPGRLDLMISAGPSIVQHLVFTLRR
jgi:hypothetical protein